VGCKPSLNKRHRFPPEVIRQAVWLYFKFTLSLRDVEDILAERGIDVSYETVRCWAEKFGGAIAANIRKTRPRPASIWHLDEMVVRINGRRMFMWRAVDQEGEVLDVLVQKRRNKRAALKLLRKLLRKQGFAPDRFVTDGLPSYGAALETLGGRSRHRPGRRAAPARVAGPHRRGGGRGRWLSLGRQALSELVGRRHRHRRDALERPALLRPA